VKFEENQYDRRDAEAAETAAEKTMKQPRMTRMNAD